MSPKVEASKKKRTAPLSLYFAYGACLDTTALQAWNQGAARRALALPKGTVGEAQGVELVFDSVSERWEGRVAGLQKRKGASVLGKVLEIPDADWPLIREWEGACDGRVETPVTVKVGTRKVEATAFAAAPGQAAGPGPVSEPYILSWVRGAEVSGLPKAYLEEVKAEAQILQRVQAFGRRVLAKK